ncbi:hypothetical protein ACO0K7_07770 [Undibacterium sp. Ji67W]|uniref:hypothetical protein n=1 Tax=Undibacterium sp. Ji67W TaxID=3413042 RepID=UPI003BF2E6ED
MDIVSRFGVLEIVNEPNYTFRSADNGTRYAAETLLPSMLKPTSMHGVWLNGAPIAVFGAAGGCSTIHQHSAVLLDDNLYLAVGDSIVCFNLGGRELVWALPVDSATCFGIHYDARRDALISHGELEIARVSKDGKIVWTSSGADIFSEGLTLQPDFIQAIDFNRKVYRFDFSTGLEFTR